MLKSTQRNLFFLEACITKAVHPYQAVFHLYHTDNLQSKFCYLLSFTQRHVCEWKIWAGLRRGNLSPNGNKCQKTYLPWKISKTEEEEVTDRSKGVCETQQKAFLTFCIGSPHYISLSSGAFKSIKPKERQKPLTKALSQLYHRERQQTSMYISAAMSILLKAGKSKEFSSLWAC